MSIKLTDKEMEELIKSINDTPAEIKTLYIAHGKWIEYEREKRCSICGHSALYERNSNMQNKSSFCPYCGARMDLK